MRTALLLLLLCATTTAAGDRDHDRDSAEARNRDYQRWGNSLWRGPGAYNFERGYESRDDWDRERDRGGRYSDRYSERSSKRGDD